MRFKDYIKEDFEKAKMERDRLEDVLKNAQDALKNFVGKKTGPMNLTPDNVKNNPKWKKLKRDVDVAFQNLRKFNSTFTKKYKKEIRADRRR